MPAPGLDMELGSFTVQKVSALYGLIDPAQLTFEVRDSFSQVRGAEDFVACAVTFAAKRNESATRSTHQRIACKQSAYWGELDATRWDTAEFSFNITHRSVCSLHAARGGVSRGRRVTLLT